MNKLKLMVLIAGLFVAFSASSALAHEDPDPFPSDSTANCTAAGGVTSGVPGVSRTCVVTTVDVIDVENSAGKSDRSWSASVEKTDVVTYTTFNTTPRTREHSHETTYEVLACTNPGGNTPDDWQTNPNCLPS